jgi:hypothetical protein
MSVVIYSAQKLNLTILLCVSYLIPTYLVNMTGK